MTVYHFVDPEVRVEIFFKKGGTIETGEVHFEIGGSSTYTCITHLPVFCCSLVTKKEQLSKWPNTLKQFVGNSRRIV